MSHHHDEVEEATSPKTLTAYLTGLGLCLIFTFMAFGLVEMHLASDANLYILLTVLAIAQLFVQSVCFLGLNGKRAGSWNVLPYLFTIFIIAILVFGTLWIMISLDFNMMN